MENEMVECAIDFLFSLSPSCRLPQRNDYSLVPGRGGNEISAFPFSVSSSIFASQELMVWFIEPSRAALLLSLKTFCLGVKSTYCVVWAESLTMFKAFPPTMYHFKTPLYDL